MTKRLTEAPVPFPPPVLSVLCIEFAMCAGGVTDGLHRMDECRCGGTGAFCCRDAACIKVGYDLSLVAQQMTYTRLLTLLDCLCGGGGGGQLRCGGNAGGLMGPPFRIIGLILSLVIVDLGLSVTEFVVADGTPPPAPTRNCSRIVETMLDDGGGGGGVDSGVFIAALCTRAVLTTPKVDAMFRLLFEILRAGVGGGGGFTEGRATTESRECVK